MPRIALRAALLAVLVLAITATTALAFTAETGTYKGKSGQKRTVGMKVGKQHRVNQFHLDWRAPCKAKGIFWSDSTKFKNGTSSQIVNSGDSFSDGGSYTSHANGGYTGKITVTLNGAFISDTKAKGVFGVTVKVFKSGKQIDTCEKPNIKWHVSR